MGFLHLEIERRTGVSKRLDWENQNRKRKAAESLRSEGAPRSKPLSPEEEKIVQAMASALRKGQFYRVPDRVDSSLRKRLWAIAYERISDGVPSSIARE